MSIGGSVRENGSGDGRVSDPPAARRPGQTSLRRGKKEKKPGSARQVQGSWGLTSPSGGVDE